MRSVQDQDAVPVRSSSGPSSGVSAGGRLCATYFSGRASPPRNFGPRLDVGVGPATDVANNFGLSRRFGNHQRDVPGCV